MIQIRDITNRQTVSLTSFKKVYHQYRLYANCQELHSANYQQLQRLVTEAHKNKHIITCVKHKTLNNDTKDCLKLSYPQQFNGFLKKQRQLSSLIYVEQIHTQRKQQLQQQIMQVKDKSWRNYKLQELQHINSSACKLLSQIIKHN